MEVARMSKPKPRGPMKPGRKKKKRAADPLEQLKQSVVNFAESLLGAFGAQFVTMTCADCGQTFPVIVPRGEAPPQFCAACLVKRVRFRPVRPAPSSKRFQTREQAALFIATYAVVPKDFILAHESSARAAYRKAAAKLHPDNKETGSAEQFKLLGEAWGVLYPKNQKPAGI
jgi:DnaJ domain